MNRRDLLAAATAAGATVVTTRPASAAAPLGSVRVAHVTDTHITADRKAPEGMAALFAHMFDRPDRPEIVLNTGDTVMAVDGGVTGAAAAAQIALWKDAVKQCPVPIHSCLGNHDIWGGKEPTPDVPAAKAGAALMVETLGMPHRWHSFDHGGWHIVALDSMSALGALSAEQVAWLEKDLAATPRERPVCILSHLPIVSVTSSLYGDSRRRGNSIDVPGGWQHADCWLLSEIFRAAGNVRLCLSGHMHTQDRCEYRGTWYICGGAASGAWWNGAEYGFPPCYGLIDLHPDGRFDYAFVDYGWPAREWRGKRRDPAG